ncbi:hypothetical protein BX600DRAFT_437335 [Xylariales sp. PMI_506]|nr:hypothetical protein BX600DRAFT_437335 [Xylariales sp. PMI_506]
MYVFRSHGNNWADGGETLLTREVDCMHNKMENALNPSCTNPPFFSPFHIPATILAKTGILGIITTYLLFSFMWIKGVARLLPEHTHMYLVFAVRFMDTENHTPECGTDLQGLNTVAGRTLKIGSGYKLGTLGDTDDPALTNLSQIAS